MRSALDVPSVIRPVTLNDAEAIAAIYAPYVRETPYTFEEAAPDAAEIRRRIAELTPRYPYFVGAINGHVVGYAYGCAHRPRASYRWAADVAVYVERGQHRRGVARALYGELLPALERYGYTMAYAGITVPNEPSIALHESLGFTRVALYHNVGYKLGAWRDVGWWERPLAPLTNPPREPGAR